MNTTSSARSSDQPSTRANPRRGRILTHWRWLFLAAVLVAIGCFPLYGILFPPSADLSLHVMISKLLWEKLAGVSHLDIEISWYLGYRLWAYLIVLVISCCKLFGASLMYVPTLVALSVVSIHAAVIAAIYYPDL